MTKGVRQTENGVVQTVSGVAQTVLETSSVEIITNWEAGDLTTNNWTGDTANYSVTTTNPFDGTYACESLGGDPIISGSLPNYPQRGDYFKIPCASSGAGDRQRWYWGPDVASFGSGSAYMLWVDDDGFIRLYDNGSRNLLGEISIDGSNITAGNYYQLHVDYGYTTTDDIEVLYYGSDGTLVGTIGPITDTTYTNTTTEFGYRHFANEGNPVRTDFIHINNDDQSVV